MNLSFLPSLQSIAATKIVARLCNGADVVTLITECDELFYRGERWKEIEKRVYEKMSLLCQPAPLREQLSSFVVPMCDQIRGWKKTHVRHQWAHFPGFKIKEFRWTFRGTLDKKGTAEAFVRDSTLPKKERYAMACLYCLEWDDPVPFLIEEVTYSLSQFQAFWTYDRTGDATALDSDSRTPYQHAFDYAVKWNNVVAAEYYFRKLSPGEREESLSDVKLYNRTETDFDLFRFLLLHMDDRQRSKLLEADGMYLLARSLDWPWQQFFMDVARLVMDVKDTHYHYVLKEIVKKITDGYEDYNYRELFARFWVQIPVAHKKELILKSCLRVLELIGEKNISLMLKDLSTEEREELLLSEKGILACYRLARNHEWDLLEFFIHECLSSCDKMIHFKEECKKAKDFGSPFFEWMDGLIEKRGREEKDCPVPHKGLCSSPGVSADHA